MARPREGRFPEGPARAARKSEPGRRGTLLVGGCGWGGSGAPSLQASGLLFAGAAGSPGGAETEPRPAPGCPTVRETGPSSTLSSNWVSALCPSLSSLLPTLFDTPILSPAVLGVSLPARGAGARGPGVQPAAVECLFSKDSEIKKVEFTDSPESRKEAASSKLFPRQHPGTNGKTWSEAQAERWAPASRPPGLE